MKLKKINVLLISFIIILFLCNCNSNKQIIIDENVSNDSIEREKILKILSKRLNHMIPNYKNYLGKNRFYTRDGYSGEFDIVDLTDTLNISRAWNKIHFIKNHIYHYYPDKHQYSINNLLFINNKGELIFYNALNCEKGDKIENVLIQLNEMLLNDNKKKETL